MGWNIQDPENKGKIVLYNTWDFNKAIAKLLVNPNYMMSTKYRPP